MLKKPIKDLKGKQIAIVAMGESQLDFHIATAHSKKYDEVWAINAMAGVIPNPDRVFAMDPMTRFFDTMPKLRHVVEVTNPKTNVKSEVVLEGLQSFLE